jgi:NAD+ synthase (glutamine-hydrolysing)
MKIAMAQINTTVGDLDGNIQKIESQLDTAKLNHADLVLFPELAVTGYPPQDLLLEMDFIKENKMLLEKLIARNHGIAGVVGFVDYVDKDLFNAAAVFVDNKVAGIRYKTLLPTYDVFDEARYFKAARPEQITPINVILKGEKCNIGVEICEDLWDANYEVKVTELLAQRGANVILSISSSPYYAGKRFERQELLKERATKNQIPIFYENLVGGQDELVFDGQSMAVDAFGNLIAIGKQFEEDLVTVNINLEKPLAKKVEPPQFHREEEMFNALVLGIRDYFWKTGFKKAAIGLSGGIDSSLTVCIATAALGKENVIGLSMPSLYSSDHSRTDAQKLARNLDILFIQFPIQDIVNSYRQNLETPLEEIRQHFEISKENDDPVADENIQPRVRGNSLMDISNRLKELRMLIINAGNKTELALGYCTLYGDMAGGIGALGDVSKLEVYNLARFVNAKAGKEIIPRTVLLKKPSPELKQDQFDPFDFGIISPMVDEIIENRRSPSELVALGYPEEAVKDTYRRIRNAEYKRRQAVPSIKITRKAFGIGWKMPIVNKYKR